MRNTTPRSNHYQAANDPARDFSGRFLCFLASFAVLCASTTVALGHGAYHEELQRTDEQIAAKPDDAQLWFHRGYINFLHGDWKQSLLDLEKVEKLAPGQYPVGLIRGQAWMASGKLVAAQKSLDDFVKSHPDCAEAYAARARLMLKLENPDAAADDFRQALAKTKSPEPDLYIETADALIAGKHPDQAVKELQAGIAKLGEIPSLACKALELEQSQGLYDAALSRVAALQKIAPRPEPWMARRASILAQAGRNEDALTAWTALRDHLRSLPNLERGSHSMSVLMEQSLSAIQNLQPSKSISPKPVSP